MLNPLLSRKKINVPPQAVTEVYNRLRVRALFGIFIGYAAYYFVRANFTLSTPYLMSALDITKSQIGLLSSCLLITYGLSKGVMSVLADKCNPKYYMMLGLGLSCIVNVFMGFSAEYWMFVVLVILNGLFQGMGAGPAFITIASWFPRLQRGRTSAIWGISHNVGGGMVAPIAIGAFAVFGAHHWQAASYWAPAIFAFAIIIVVLLVGVGTTYNEGLPPVNEIIAEQDSAYPLSIDRLAPESMSAFQIFRVYVLPNKHVWYISFVDAFVYLIRFGVITWLPIYLLQSKGFSKEQMGLAFAFFEWAAIPSTLFAGLLTDKYFKGQRMPLAILCMTGIAGALVMYAESSSLFFVTFACGLIGCLIYVPQFLASVQTMEVVPSFAVGSAVGLRGFMSYVVGTTIGTAVLGKLIDIYGWNASLYLLLFGSVMCIFFCVLAHRGSLELEAKRNKLSHTDDIAL
ncbi:MFS transporter [Pseudomonas oryzihabitans]|uniref:MFS transporter n=1 Tax=Pseudomonas oryzihabitans TaxID=47885 RepID=UPI0025539DEB|nr:MFS transporter [Pseudomonas oryzihabitans]MDK8264915.1 MFS transporter [Pseudomonas oryzihabitans]